MKIYKSSFSLISVAIYSKFALMYVSCRAESFRYEESHRLDTNVPAGTVKVFTYFLLIRLETGLTILF